MSVHGNAYDHEHVNFDEDYELNDHLKKHDKRQTEKNRDTLKAMGIELKLVLNKTVLTHKEFDAYIAKNLGRLD